jgi:hypothetical protein
MLDRVDSFTDLRVVMDSRMSFSRHIDVTVGKALEMLMGFVKKLADEVRDPYMWLVRLKLEYASCVWRPFYVVHISTIERLH